ncbi:hypothetical protein Hanom_Chr05g00467781 [Helianthus anomalus]
MHDNSISYYKQTLDNFRYICMHKTPEELTATLRSPPARSYLRHRYQTRGGRQVHHQFLHYLTQCYPSQSRHPFQCSAPSHHHQTLDLHQRRHFQTPDHPSPRHLRTLHHHQILAQSHLFLHHHHPPLRQVHQDQYQYRCSHQCHQIFRCSFPELLLQEGHRYPCWLQLRHRSFRIKHSLLPEDLGRR